MLTSFYGLELQNFTIGNETVTRAVQRGKSETQLITIINSLREKDLIPNKEVKAATQFDQKFYVNNGGQLYEEANKINISEFFFKTHPDYYIERCFFGNHNCIYDWKLVGTRVWKLGEFIF